MSGLVAKLMRTWPSPPWPKTWPKMSATRKRWIAPVAVFYIAAFSLLTIAFGPGMPVGIAYGIWAASGVALTAIGARVFFRERLT